MLNRTASEPQRSWSWLNYARRSSLVRATMLAFVVAAVAYFCFGGFHWRRSESWVPGTISKFELPELKTYEHYGPITWAPDLQQPIVGQSGPLAERGANLFAVDRSRFARSLLRSVQPGGWAHQSVVGLWRGHAGETIAVFGEPSGLIPVIVPSSGPVRFAKSMALNQRVWLDPACYGCDTTTFVIAADKQLKRHARATGEPTGEDLTLPFEPDGRVYQTSDGSFIGLERVERAVTIHSAGRPSLTFDGSEVSTLSRIGDDAYLLSSRRNGFQRLRVDDEVLTIFDDPLNVGGYVIAIDEQHRRFVVANDKQTFKSIAFRGSGVEVAATLSLVDYDKWDVIASQHVKFLKGESDGLNRPWWDAVFAPDGDRLWVLNNDCTVSEIDVDAWIEASR